jgi:hypothetical protein
MMLAGIVHVMARKRIRDGGELGFSGWDGRGGMGLVLRWVMGVKEEM